MFAQQRKAKPLVAFQTTRDMHGRGESHRQC